LINNLSNINFSITISFGLLFVTYCYLFLNNESTFFIGLWIFSLLISKTFFPNTIFGKELIDDSKNSSSKNSKEEISVKPSPDVKLSENLLNLNIIDSYYSDDFSKCIYFCNLSIKNFGYTRINLSKRAECLENLGYYLNAIKDYELDLEISGKDPNINGLMGILYFKIGYIELAKKNLIIAIDGGFPFYKPTLQLVNISSKSEIVSKFEFEKAKESGLHEIIDTAMFSTYDLKLDPIEVVAKRAILCLERKKIENKSNEELYNMMINYVNNKYKALQM
jgi:tetratricopeptide (TPR) repeat protein